MLALNAISKRYGDVSVVEPLDLVIDEGEFFCILGSSGCGKTTLLRMIAGFDRPTAGRIMLDGVDITDVPPNHRDVNTVFQNYALFPHYRVYDNVAYGLKVRKTPEAEIRDRVAAALELVGLSGFERRMPAQLSGGQQQRVALARALINRPRLLLLDEPLSALDRKTGEQMRQELADLQARSGITFVFVTHNQAEALSMASRVAVMNRGVFEQCSTPFELYQRPQTRFVGDFVGSMNFFQGVVTEVSPDRLGVEVLGQSRIERRGASDLAPGDTVVFGLRPEQLRVSLLAPKDYENGFFGQIERTLFLGEATQLSVRLKSGERIDVKVPNYLMLEDKVMGLEQNEDVWVVWSKGSGVVLHA
ncbi:ABC transporter ATP-binding protein [Thiohalocapsa marina]|uniref:Spermidine/putrescine import ATP-binding protein PotA n=1 Tax=Thiohalocapsa marina TaxID=424902 RepID=A0A5M8FUF3_9GAMM|nr:ABC transporter ATP-binding protein [Thiohalocapsa marina]KAA6187432.1 ABC transporter ATP-binding protein [Thiohalocapsa marina]